MWWGGGGAQLLGSIRSFGKTPPDSQFPKTLSSTHFVTVNFT